MTGAARFPIPLLAVALALLALPACGRKASPRPPEDAVPQAIRELTAENIEPGIRLTWERPRVYADGSKLYDLAGFEIWRMSPPQETQFRRIDTVIVEDRERFQQVKKFARVDSDIQPGNLYQYYLVTFTLDGYFSQPSNVATITRMETEVE